MAVFTIWQHSQLPICKAEVTKHIKLSKEWGLRYQLQGVADDLTPLGLLDEKMGKACKAPGVYAARFDDVLVEWQRVLDSAPPVPPPEPEIQETEPSHSASHVVVAVVALLVMCVGIMLRILCIPLYIGFAIVGGGAPSVIATIALIDGWLHLKWLQDVARGYIKDQR